jgi:hypothetical protein
MRSSVDDQPSAVHLGLTCRRWHLTSNAFCDGGLRGSTQAKWLVLRTESVEDVVADVEFFWDPVCPWAWITSRWMVEVQHQRGLDVSWRFISLRMINADKDYERDFPPGYLEGHGRGLRMLRVAAAAKADGHEDRVGDFYTAFGTTIHPGQSPTRLDTEASLVEVLREHGLPTLYATAHEDTSFDDEIRASTDEGLRRAGGNVGTPIISWSPPDGPSFFGPVISRIPRGEEAVRLWDAITELGSNPWFAELKRSVRARPQFD